LFGFTQILTTMVAEKSELNVFWLQNLFTTHFEPKYLKYLRNNYKLIYSKKNHLKNRNQPESKTQPELRFFSPQILKAKIT
jgi:acyl-[acyl carrier protein]--UDP-N-acetylglucosamine O-acyltransferase